MAISSGQQQVAGQTLSRSRLVRGGLWAAATVVALVVAGVGGVLFLAGVVPSDSGPASSQLQDAGFAVSAVALVVLVVAAARLARAGRASASAWFLAPASTRGQRAQALRSVRHGRAVDDQAMALTVAVAGAAARRGRGALVWVAIALTLAGGAMGMATWWLALMMVAVVAMGVLAAITAQDARWVRRWLATHGQSAGALR